MYLQLSFSLFRIISFVALFFIIEHYSRNTLLANKDLSLSIIIYIERERDRGRERHTERDRERQRDRDRERQRQGETERQRERNVLHSMRLVVFSKRGIEIFLL